MNQTGKEIEAKRVAALERYRILDTAQEKAFDDLAMLVARACRVPMAIVSFIDSTRQWYKSKVGCDATEVPIESTFCKCAIERPYEVLAVSDASLDKRFKDHPLVKGGPQIRFYLGAPITTKDGYAIGTLCAIDFTPRDIDLRDADALAALAQQTMAQLELRLHVLALEESAEKQKQIEKELREATQAKSFFLASMSHEIRTPLTSVIGFSEILRDRALLNRDEIDQAVESINRNGTHLLQVVNDILDFSKIEANELRIEHVDFSPRSIIDDVESFVSSRAKAKGITFETVIGQELPSEIHSDPTRLKQILFNLVGNALKFTERGTISFRVKRSQDGLVFSVQDTGIGISAETQKKLFQPFTQAQQDTARKYGGTGLGLAISKELAELLGGSLSLESSPGVGSCFTLTLPDQH